jgi:hypothetical protein
VSKLGVLLVLVSLSCIGCDKFFVVHRTVRSCDDVQPVPGATVHAELLDGVSEKEERTERTAQDGTYSVFLNEPLDVVVRVTYSADGFEPVEAVHDGAPEGPADVCLERQESPR